MKNPEIPYTEKDDDMVGRYTFVVNRRCKKDGFMNLSVEENPCS